MSKKQKDIFLEFEGDIYFERNNLTIQNREIGPNDPIIFCILLFMLSSFVIAGYMWSF